METNIFKQNLNLTFQDKAYLIHVLCNNPSDNNKEIWHELKVSFKNNKIFLIGFLAFTRNNSNKLILPISKNRNNSFMIDEHTKMNTKTNLHVLILVISHFLRFNILFF